MKITIIPIVFATSWTCNNIQVLLVKNGNSFTSPKGIREESRTIEDSFCKLVYDNTGVVCDKSMVSIYKIDSNTPDITIYCFTTIPSNLAYKLDIKENCDWVSVNSLDNVDIKDSILSIVHNFFRV